MQTDLIRVKAEEKEILRNLLEKYGFEFSLYDGRDVGPLGLYGYSYLDHYWTEENRFAFFMRVRGNLAGFMMINSNPEVLPGTDYTMSEFFVMYKYRRIGIGQSMAARAFDMFQGVWQLKRHPKNLASVAFWDRVISAYTHGRFELFFGHPNAEYEDGTLGDVFLFDTRTHSMASGMRNV